MKFGKKAALRSAADGPFHVAGVMLPSRPSELKTHVENMDRKRPYLPTFGMF